MPRGGAYIGRGELALKVFGLIGFGALAYAALGWVFQLPEQKRVVANLPRVAMFVLHEKGILAQRSAISSFNAGFGPPNSGAFMPSPTRISMPLPTMAAIWEKSPIKC